MTALKKLEQLAKIYLAPFDLTMFEMHPCYWGSRCVLELQYAWELSRSEGGAHEQLVSQAIELAWTAQQGQGALSADTAAAVERALAPMAALAKGYTLLCVGHAHIDMNWMWGYDETSSVTLDTFQTMLDLMDEYPEFTFGQSQASVYRIVERHNPKMLQQIKRRVHEGRWEVTASTWVEADRNMPNMESMARHFLYAKRYLSKLLDIDPETLNIDYEPDTFGHHINVPEVLCGGGVKYYYHCRGHEDHVLYNWKAPSGRSILVFREPSWYNWTMDGRCATLVPAFCKKHGMDAMLRVYGVGDHGGGPTRRDIEKIIDMDRWPIFPAFKFSTYGEFYRRAEQVRDALPVVEGELNFVFDGCYTTQTRQKRGNRLGEAMLAEAEGAAALSRLAIGADYDADAFEDAWRKVLFNQFHDILPGSGTVDTREYAMGQYQEAFTAANTSRAMIVRALSDAADTSALGSGEDIGQTRSEGAGVGYGLSDGRISQLGRHAGLRRLFTVYNPLPFARESVAEFPVWDWNGNAARMRWTDASGQPLAHQVQNHGMDNYWGHLHTDVLVRVKVPAMGYTTVVLDEDPPQAVALPLEFPRVDPLPCNVLENEFLRAELDGRDGGVISLVDKRTGREYARPGCPMGVFRLVEEDTSRGMSAWTVGRYRAVTMLNRGVKFKQAPAGARAVRQSIAYEVGFGNGSRLEVTVSLDAHEPMLRFDAAVRWQEIGTPETFFPQLNFFMPVAYDYDTIRYDVPMGAVDRPPMDMDVPAQSYGMPLCADGAPLMLISDSKYGYRGAAEGLGLTLIRSSADPDPWPEVGAHRVRMAIALGQGSKTENAVRAQAFCRGLLVAAARVHGGSLPSAQSLLELSPNVALSAVKQAEDGSGIVVRFCELEGSAGRGWVRLFRAPVSASLVNVLEQPVPGRATVEGDTVRFDCRAHGVGSVLIRF